MAQSTGAAAPLSAALNDAFGGTRGLQGSNAIPTPGSSNTTGTVLQSDTPSSANESLRVDGQSTSFNTVLGLSDEEADERLVIFREQMLKYFPFLSLPPNVTARQLCSTRPFLFRSIAAVSTPLTQERIVASRNFKKELAQRMVIDNEASIDLLLGLLVFSSW